MEDRSRSTSSRVGVLLLNLGTPDSPAEQDVRRYLRQFLGDGRVIDIAAPLRWLLLEAIILPRRPKIAAEAYRKIWTPQGSPLLVYSRSLQEGVASVLGEGFAVELGMRYGSPSIGEAVEKLLALSVRRIVVLPLFPQYADSSTGSALAELDRVLGTGGPKPPLSVIESFCDDSRFIQAFAGIARPLLDPFGADHVLMSFHGLPERQIRKADSTGSHCLVSPDCCEARVDANRNCYRAHCYRTSRALAVALSLPPGRHSVSFQSRLGRTPWIRPFTDVVLPELAARGVRRLAVLSPSFVADCLETLEELGIRGREQWRSLGGEELLLVPCPNDSPAWIRGVAEMLRERTA